VIDGALVPGCNALSGLKGESPREQAIAMTIRLRTNKRKWAPMESSPWSCPVPGTDPSLSPLSGLGFRPADRAPAPPYGFKKRAS
jgi:hypothetical protein